MTIERDEVGEETEVADANEATRKQMEQEMAKKLASRQALAIRMDPILPGNESLCTTS